VGAYNYTVNITGGCSPPTAVGSITVNPNTSIALTSATGTDAQAVCINTPITAITYTVGNGGTGATAIGLPNGVTPSYVGSTLTMSGTPTVSGNYTYTVTTSGGCAPVSINGTINVNPLPTATISSNVTVCKGSASPNVIFTGANATAPYTFTYTINGGANQTISSIAGTTASIVVPTGTVTAFTYSLVNVQESSSTACSQNQTGSSIITIRAPSQGTLSASVHRVCQNSTSPDIVFKGSVGTAPFTFYYSTNVAVGGTTTHSVVSTGSSATVSVSTASPDTIVYTITDVQDASGIVCGIPGNFDTVIIDPLPYSTITAALNDVCLGDPAQPIYFDSYNVGAPVSFDYSISTNGGPAIAQTPLTNGTLTYTLFAPATTLGTTVYTNGVSTSNVCIGGGNGSARLTVNPIPTGTLSLTGSSTICQSGGASQVTFTGSVGKAPFIFSYNVDGAATNTISTLSNQNSVALPLTTLSVGTHTINLLAVKDTFNCAQSQTGAVTIVVDPLPTASAGGNSRICMNGTATVSGASSANGSINWTSDGAGTINNGTTLTPTYSANASDASKTVLLTMTVTSTNSCIGKTATANYTVIIDSLPLAIAGGTATICQGTSNTISNTYSRFGSILWTSNGSGSLSGATSLTPTYTAAAGDAGKLITLTMTVTSTNSCNLKPETATDFYTIKVDPLPTATSPGAQSICENATATVSGASSSNGSVNWTYNGSGTITSGGTTLTPVYAAAAGDAGKTVLLTMTVTSTNSCNVLPAIASSIYTIFVDHLPTAASPGTQSVCENRTATVSGASQNYGTPSWGVTSGAGSITAGGNTLNPTYNANSGDAGNQVILTMTVTSTNSCASQTAMSTYTISVDPLPTATTIGSYTICENASYQLQSGEAVPMYGSPAWTENGAGNITAGATNLTPTYTAAAGDAGTTVTLTMTVTSTNSCNVLPEKAMATYAIDVDPLPIAIAAAAQTICQGDSIILSGANASYGSITWTSNGKGILTNTTTVAPQYHSSAADAGKTVTLTMTVTSTNSCSLPVAAKISTTTAITVRPLLTATLNAQQSVCQNSPAQVIFTVTSKGTPPYTFTYTQDGTQTTATSNASTTASISVPTGIVKKIIYNLTTIQDANCTEPVTIPTQTVTVNPLPYATISQDEDVCRDSTAQKIKIKGSKGATPYTFTFNINNAPTSMTAPDSVLLPPLTDKVGTFVYSLTKVSDFNGCIQTLTDKVTVVVHENPNAIFTVNPERTSILEPEISITDASISASSWMWDFGDGSISASPTPETHTYADTGTYKIKLKVTNSLCKDSTSILVRITLPTSLYVPNTFSPNGDGANDVFKAEGEGIIKFEMMIFDRWGQLLFESNDINKGWDGKVNGGSSPAQMDAYVYVINIRALANKHDYTYRGIVNLIK
jgi:gliding motility-associated-like protein